MRRQRRITLHTNRRFIDTPDNYQNTEVQNSSSDSPEFRLRQTNVSHGMIPPSFPFQLPHPPHKSVQVRSGLQRHAASRVYDDRHSRWTLHRPRIDLPATPPAIRPDPAASAIVPVLAAKANGQNQIPRRWERVRSLTMIVAPTCQ